MSMVHELLVENFEKIESGETLLSKKTQLSQLLEYVKSCFERYKVSDHDEDLSELLRARKGLNNWLDRESDCFL